MKLRIKRRAAADGRDLTPSIVEVANGEYARSFNREQEPFDVSDEEFAILAPSGEFEPVPPTAAQTEG